jgi:murein DD-endopeptidase MepM/ murein hydrolase activator NlpD
MTNRKTTNKYQPPVPIDAITLVVRDNASHQGTYKGSVDLAVPVNTPVLAAADGTVTRVRDDSDRYGEDPSFGQDVNYITIEHAGSELSEYLHLARASSKVRPGQKVKQGQEIAKTGLSGWLYAPHLHFMVYESGKQFQCLDIKFEPPLPDSSDPATSS